MTEKIQNFLRGAGSVLFPTQSHREPQRLYTPPRDGRTALRSDWQRVGDSLQAALKKAANEQK